MRPVVMKGTQHHSEYATLFSRFSQCGEIWREIWDLSPLPEEVLLSYSW